MSDDVKHIKALREAYCAGAQDRERVERPIVSPSDPNVYPYGETSALRASLAAARRYPLPTVEVPRVVRVGDFDYRVRDGNLECKRIGVGGAWTSSWSFGADAVRTLSDLLANPTERVEVTE